MDREQGHRAGRFVSLACLSVAVALAIESSPVSADDNGYCVDFDCDDLNANCDLNCADSDGDGYCHPHDCLLSNPHCASDCSDADGDGIGGCYGDCDDADPATRPGSIELCTDDVDNDCDGFEDDAGPGVDSHSVYRGRILASGFAGYNHLCEAAEIEATTLVDPDRPALDEAFDYLVAGQTLQVGPPESYKAGPLGPASDGRSRPDSATITCGRRVRVDPDAVVGANDGLSWATAYTSVGAALDGTGFAQCGLEILARGNLTGAATLDGADRPAIRLLGGFAGTEVASWELAPPCPRPSGT